MLRQFLPQLWKEQSNVTHVLVPLLANMLLQCVKIKGVKTPHTGVSLDCLFKACEALWLYWK